MKGKKARVTKRRETNASAGSAARKRKGAQPGNLNALKHGFYSRHFDDLERADLDDVGAASLEGEIAMARVAQRRVFKAFVASTSSATQAQLLDTLMGASVKLATLLTKQKFLTGEGGGLEAALVQVLEEMASTGSAGSPAGSATGLAAE